MKFKLKINILFFLILFIFAFSSCGVKENNPNFYYSILKDPSNLDPQVVSSSESKLILQNSMEGLMAYNSDGQIINGVAEDYSISSDKLTYTFNLRKDAVWVKSDGEIYKNITANDFLFAFRRLFDPETKSTQNGDFMCVKNSGLVLSGQLELDSLGIEVLDNYTIKFELEYVDDNFISLLATPPSFPCNEEFFNGTKGRYGIVDEENLLYNGPFYMKNWESDSYIKLIKSETYKSSTETVAESLTVRILEKDSTQYDSFINKKSDVLILNGSQIQLLEKDKYNLKTYSDTSWVLIFNIEDELLSNKNLRQSLAYSYDNNSYREILPDWMLESKAIIPPLIDIDGSNYRSIVKDDMIIKYNKNTSENYFKQSVEELGLKDSTQISLYYPQNSAYTQMMQNIQNTWQKNLSTFVSVEPMSESDILSKVSTGDFDIALLPLKLESNTPFSILNMFTSTSNKNFARYYSPIYDGLIQEANLAENKNDQSLIFGKAEKLLIDDVVVIPFAYQDTYYITNQNVNNILFLPYGNIIYFKYATKIE